MIVTGKILACAWTKATASRFRPSWCCVLTAWPGKFVYQVLILEDLQKWAVRVIFLGSRCPMTHKPTCPLMESSQDLLLNRRWPHLEVASHCSSSATRIGRPRK